MPAGLGGLQSREERYTKFTEYPLKSQHQVMSQFEIYAWPNPKLKKRFTRLTDAFSKKIENYCHVLALHFAFYNFVKIHNSLRVTPAMQVGLVIKRMTLADIANLVEEATPKKRGTYKKKNEKQDWFRITRVNNLLKTN